MAYLGKTPSQAVRSRYYYTATGGETSLSGADDNSNVLTFTDGNYVDVSLNGATLVAGSDYNTTTANTIGGLVALTASDVVEVVVYDTFSVFGGNMAADLNFKDNVKANFGTGNDLQIFHDGSNSIIRDAGTGSLKFQYGTSDGVVFDSSGNVGIGETAPANLLHVKASDTGIAPHASAQIVLEREGTNYLQFLTAETGTSGILFGDGSDVDVASIKYDHNSTVMSFVTEASERLRITGSGFVGIGESAPQKMLHITRNDSDGVIVLDANGTTTDHQICFSKDYGTGGTTGGNYWGIGVDGSENKLVFAYDPNAQASLSVDAKVVINSSGNVGIGTTTTSYGKFTVQNTAGTGKVLLDNYQSVPTTENVMAIYADASNGYIDSYNNGYKNIIIAGSGGNVGIGTSSPSGKLNLATGPFTPCELHLTSNNTGSASGDRGAIVVHSSRNDGTAYEAGKIVIDRSSGTTDEAHMIFATNGGSGNTERMRIDSSGRVGIGTTSITSPFVVNTAFNSGYISQFVNTGTGADPNGVLIQAGVLDSAYILRLTKQDATDVLAVRGSGNVGIGTTAAYRPLEVQSSSADADVASFGTSADGGQGLLFSVVTSSDKRTRIRNNTSGTYDMAFEIANSEKMRINSNGNVLVGTSSPYSQGERLAVSYPYLSGTGIVVDSGAGGGAAMRFRTNSTLVGSIITTTSSTAYNTSSDYRLKTAVTYDWDATSRLKQLKPVRFEWIADGDDAVPVDGFLAHEVEDIVPESITGTKDAMRDEEYEVTPAVLDEDGNEVTPAVMGTRSVPDYQGIDQSKLVPLLVKTIQELEARIVALENI